MERIDSHQHFWVYDPQEMGWISDDMATIRRDFLPSDLRPEIEKIRYDGCIAVQARQSLEENEFLLGLADRSPFIRGVVGWVDLTAADVVEQLDKYAMNSKFVGVRHIVQGEPAGFLAAPRFLAGVRKLADFDLAYDLLVREHQLDEAIAFCRALEGHRIVLDHIGKPNIKEEAWEPWASQLRELSKVESLHCKLSGMSFEADWANDDPRVLQPYVDHVLDCFGPDRCMIGSDWPVSLVAGEYFKTLMNVEECLSPLSREEKWDVMGGTAIRFYKLPSGSAVPGDSASM